MIGGKNVFQLGLSEEIDKLSDFKNKQFYEEETMVKDDDDQNRIKDIHNSSLQ